MYIYFIWRGGWVEKALHFEGSKTVLKLSCFEALFQVNAANLFQLKILVFKKFRILINIFIYDMLNIALDNVLSRDFNYT